MISIPFLINYVGYSLPSLSVIAVVGSLMQSSFIFFADKFEYKLGDKRSFLLTILVFPISTISYAFSRNLVLTAALSGIYFSTISFSEVVMKNYLSHNVSDDKRATIISINSMFVSLFALASLPIIGAIVDTVSLQNSLILLAAIVAILGLLLLSQYQSRKATFSSLSS